MRAAAERNNDLAMENLAQLRSLKNVKFQPSPEAKLLNPAS